MKTIPDTEDTLVLRTDFSDPTAWTSICAEIEQPIGEDGFQPYVEFLSDPKYDGLTVEGLLALLTPNYNHFGVFIVDRTALSHPERPILVVNARRHDRRTFRVVPSEMWSVESNLSLANMDWEDFADWVDPDGIFRGFGQ